MSTPAVSERRQWLCQCVAYNTALVSSTAANAKQPPSASKPCALFHSLLYCLYSTVGGVALWVYGGNPPRVGDTRCLCSARPSLVHAAVHTVGRLHSHSRPHRRIDEGDGGDAAQLASASSRPLSPAPLHSTSVPFTGRGQWVKCRRPSRDPLHLLAKAAAGRHGWRSGAGAVHSALSCPRPQGGATPPSLMDDDGKGVEGQGRLRAPHRRAGLSAAGCQRSCQQA